VREQMTLLKIDEHTSKLEELCSFSCRFGHTPFDDRQRANTKAINSDPVALSI